MSIQRTASENVLLPMQHVEDMSFPVLNKDQIPEVYLGKQFLFLDPKTKQLGITSEWNETTAKEVNIYFVDKIKEMRVHQEWPKELKDKYIELISLHLEGTHKKLYSQISQGFNACKNDGLLMTTAHVDRYLAAVKYGSLKRLVKPKELEGDSVLGETLLLSIKDAQSYFKTQIAKDMVKYWTELKTHSGILGKAKDDDGKLVRSEYACNAFLHQPEEVDFIRENHFHRKAARFNHPIYVDHNTFNHRMRFHKHNQNVFQMMSWTGCAKKDYNCEDGFVVVNDHIKLTSLPVFKPRKPEKGENDYRVVIKSAVYRDVNHCWLELKDPRNVYSVGYSFKPGQKIPLYKPCLSVKAELVTPDRAEFLGLDDKVIKTTIAISQQQFEKIKGFIEINYLNKEDISYNLISNNCTSFVRKALEQIDVKLPSKDGRVLTLMGFADRNAQFTKENYDLPKIVYRCYSFFRNFTLYVLAKFSVGSKKRNDVTDLDEVMPSLYDVTRAEAGEIDHPIRVYQWQRHIEQQKRVQLDSLESSQLFASMTPEEQKEARDAIKYCMPSNIINID